MRKLSTTRLTPKTRTIAGRTVTLFEGVRYVASREMRCTFNRRQRVWPVTIQAMIGEPLEAESVIVGDLTCDEADRFLAAFNGGTTSFDGRLWGASELCEVCEEYDAEFEAVVLGTTTGLCAGCREGGIENGTLDAEDCADGAAR